MIQIRRATIEDKDNIFALIKKGYQGRWEYKIPDRWYWEYVNNPFKADTQLPIWIAVNQQGQVVGQSCVMLEPIKYCDTITHVAWGTDLYVDPAYRSQGIASKLKLAARDEFNNIIMASLDMSPVTRKIYMKYGYAPIEKVISYRRMLKLDKFAETQAFVNHFIPGGAVIRRVIGKLLRTFHFDGVIANKKANSLEENDLKIGASIDKSLHIDPIDTFDEEITLLWDTVSPKFDAIVIRDHPYLNWKYVDKPHVDYLKFVARRNDNICGYLIIRMGQPPEPPIGIITDLFAAPDDKKTIIGLISYAVNWFKKADVRSIVAATNVQSYQTCFAESGFEKFKETIPMVQVGETAYHNEKDITATKWLLCKGDQDWDQYPLANDIP